MTTLFDENKKTLEQDKLKLVKKSYFKGFMWSTFLVTLAAAAATCVNRFFPLGEAWVRLIQVISVVPGAAALYGVKQWDIQTFTGNTKPEILNQKLFNFLSTLGLFLPVGAFALVPV